jgi:hypothetical protein
LSIEHIAETRLTQLEPSINKVYTVVNRSIVGSLCKVSTNILKHTLIGANDLVIDIIRRLHYIYNSTICSWDRCPVIVILIIGRQSALWVARLTV